MTILIANALCSKCVDYPENPWLLSWQKFLHETARVGYKSIELGPWDYLPVQADELRGRAESASALTGCQPHF